MPGPRLVSFRLVDAPARGGLASGQARVIATPAGGRESSFLAATFDRPEAWMADGRADWFEEPVLYVRRLDEAAVRAAADAMAAELGGYWLRYYRAPAAPPAPAALGTASIRGARGGCGVVEAVLKDGREFSILTARPRWWREELERRGLDFYFGPMVLFLRALDASGARRAAARMARTDVQLFCRYDTPRKALPEVLDSFQAARR